ncbi:MAG TPA: allophanate hydrolase, partial [Ilumatobacteraceae bacterium]
MDPTGWTIGSFAAEYQSGTSVVEVIDRVLVGLGAAPRGVLIDEPLTASARADAARLVAIDPTSLPLYGVPFVVKDNIDVGGVATTAGCPGYAYVADEDATIVALLRAAGAVVVGKANLDQFATGLVGTRSPYGTPPNVLDSSLVPGGSSSGSAVAVALGLVPFSLGTDTAGSGRVPAALNGVVGLKPTLGRVSTRGLVPAMRRFDCPSVFARNVEDATLVADLIAAVDVADSFMRVPRRQLPFRHPVVIGVPATWPAELEMSSTVLATFAVAVEELRALGCAVVPVDIDPLVEIGTLLYGSPLVAERGAAVGEAVEKGVAGLDPVVGSIIGRATDIGAIEAYRTEYELIRLRAAAAGLWDDIDVLALPTLARQVTLDDVRHDPFGRNEVLGRLTTFVNLLDLMAVVVPMRAGGAVVPNGLQLIAPAWQDAEVCRLARGFETG